MDFELPITFCDLSNLEVHHWKACENVIEIRKATRMLANDVIIVDYDEIDGFNAVMIKFPKLDQTRLQCPMAKDPGHAEYEATPRTSKVLGIVSAIHELNSGRRETV